MSKALQRITPWIAGAALAVSLSACGTPSSTEQPPMPDPIAPPATVQESMPPDAVDPDPSLKPPEPVDPPEDSGDEQAVEGEEVTTDTITANMMEMEIPSGIKIPEDTLVTKADRLAIMMADPDPAAVTAMVESSAAEAGYEVYAEVADGKVFVGNGNAVLFTATPMAQTLTWGPERMKDLLAEA